MDTFGDRLRTARKARSLTQDELADLIDVTKSAVSGWENNRDLPGLDKLPKLRVTLGVSLDALVCGVGDAGITSSYALRDSAAPAYIASTVNDLSRDQQRIIRAFERLTDRKRKALLQLLDD